MWELKPGRHYTEHCVRIAIKLNGLAAHFRIAAKTFLPQRVADDGHVIGARLVFAFRVDPAEQRRDAHQIKEASRGCHAGDSLRDASSCDSIALRIEDRNGLK